MNIIAFRSIFLSLFCLMYFLQVNAQQDNTGKKMNFQAYSGGMMLHTGYVFGGKLNIDDYNQNIKIQGVTFGIGGTLRFNFGKHLRTGLEGYSTSVNYGKNKSYMTLGWGGLLIDCKWDVKKLCVFVGGTIGGGAVKNVTVVNDTNINPIGKTALYRKYAVILVDPFIGIEYALSPKIRLIAKADYIINVGKQQPDFATGVRVYAGVVFFHQLKYR